MAGYSGTPLAKKLGIKPGHRIVVKGAPEDYEALVEPLPEKVTLSRRMTRDHDILHVFSKSAGELERGLPRWKDRIRQDGAIWVSWPKKASKVPTDVTEDVIRRLALPLGLVDVKVCAVNEVWSGLKLVVRRALRKKPT